MEKYILNTGISSNPNLKIHSLNLIFPGESGKKIIDSEYFKPTIGLLACKPNTEDELKDFIKEILQKNLPENLVFQ